MNHGYFQDRLSAYFDQALTLEEMQMMKEHLESCAECRDRLEDLAKLDRLIDDNAALGESDYWEKAAQKIESRLTSPEKTEVTDIRSSWFGLGWKLAAAAASVAALTFVALHEGEIQNSAVKSKRATETATAPSKTFNDPSMPDTGMGQAYDFVDTEAESPEPKPALEPTAERVELKDKSPSLKKSPATSVSEDASEKLELDHSPVTSVDELLESVAGVVTNSSGETFIRGGRAGEVAYIVDGVPIGDPLGGLAEDTKEKEVVVDLGTTALTRKRTDIGKTITVQGQRDIIDKFETSNQAAITKEQIMQQPVTSVEELLELPGVVINDDGEIFIGDTSNASHVLFEEGTYLYHFSPAETPDGLYKLNYWRWVRDTLQTLIEQPREMWYSTIQKSKKALDRRDGDLSLDSPPPPTVSDSIHSPTPLERYLEACFKIAELTDRESEYDSAVVIIETYAKDRNSPVQELARHYLDMIDDLQE